MEKTIISSEMISPSLPTPHHLKNYKLSIFDHTPSCVPLVFYFTNTGHHRETDDEQLKTSLSRTLTRFYPLAGRASEDCQSIDCSDQGIPFLVANIKGHQLSDFLKPRPDIMLFIQLFPCQPEGEWGPGCSVAMIQVNHFECGGVAVGVIFSHMVVDAVTMSIFLKYWAATARGIQPGPGPDYTFRSVFPQKEKSQNSVSNPAESMEEDNFVTTRYVFDGSAMRRLKAESGVESPTRFVLVTALLWKGYMAASLANHHKTSAVSHVVDLRRRAQPPFPSECFGNMIANTLASYNNDSIYNNDILRHLVKELKEATSKIDDNYVNRMRGDKGYMGFYENMKLIWDVVPGGVDDCLLVSSWLGMGFYDVDFGQGKPEYLTPYACLEFPGVARNAMILMDTRLGDGVEAWVTLKQKYMKVFENVEELKKHAFAVSSS